MLVSLCLLAYKRPEWLSECVKSIHANSDVPFELIVNADADDETGKAAYELYKDGLISKLVLVAGKNRGVGRSFQNCLGLAEGDYIFKVDSDIMFELRWLSPCIKILADQHVAALSPFDYRHYDPADTRFQIEKETESYFVVNDFVSSIYGFRRMWWDINKGKMPDDGFHQELRKWGDLAITKTDLVTNRGFGIGKTVYVSLNEKGEAVKTPTHDMPKVFGY